MFICRPVLRIRLGLVFGSTERVALDQSGLPVALLPRESLIPLFLLGAASYPIRYAHGVICLPACDHLNAPPFHLMLIGHRILAHAPILRAVLS